tara:strand:+ start:1885 stop:2151 length:267 start_codon:yes stop_codon:yes gene_type:complete
VPIAGLAPAAADLQQFPMHFTHEQPGASNDTDGFEAQQPLLAQSYHEAQVTFPYESGSEMVDPGWGLFDTQPTLDWLDADFTFFESNQ